MDDDQRSEGPADAGGKYDAVVWVEKLPHRRTSHHPTVELGYATSIGGSTGISGATHWYWFDALLPALAFGRAARMSVDCSSWGVWPAAREVRTAGDGWRTLRVLSGANLGRGPQESEQLRHWVEGVVAGSAYWHGPTT